MFHWQDNVFFGRKHDGSVKILRLAKPPEDWHGWPAADTEHPDALLEIVVDADSWASIIASVSAGGEIFNRFYAAQKFHASAGEIDIVGADWPAGITTVLQGKHST